MDKTEIKQADKRRLKRRHLIFYLRVFDRGTNQMIGHIVNITMQGVMIISDHPIGSGCKFNLCMHLPYELGKGNTIDFVATSVWNRRDVNPEFYNSGFTFDSIDEKDRKTIIDLIDRFGLEDVWE
jgi:hypothetical protein